MHALLLGCLLLQPSAEPPADSVAGPPPLIVKATVEKDQLVSNMTVTKTLYSYVAVQREVGGKVVTEYKSVPHSIKSNLKKVWDLKKAKITNASGKKMDLDTLRKRLAVETPVVVSVDGKPVSKGYLNLMRADVIVIEAPPVPDAAPDSPPIRPLVLPK